MFTFRVSHLDPQRRPFCPTTGYDLQDCPAADALPPWPNLPAVSLDGYQSLATESPLVDRMGGALASEPLLAYFNSADDPNAPIAHCGASICGDLNDPTQQLTDFSMTLRWATEPTASVPSTEFTLRTTFALSPQ